MKFEAMPDDLPENLIDNLNPIFTVAPSEILVTQE